MKILTYILDEYFRQLQYSNRLFIVYHIKDILQDRLKNSEKNMIKSQHVWHTKKNRTHLYSDL